MSTTPPTLPHNAIQKGSTATFSERTLPQALQAEHDLKANRWGVLHVLEGRVHFVDLETGAEQHLTAPTTHVIVPQSKHKLRLDGPLQCRVDFFADGDADT